MYCTSELVLDIVVLLVTLVMTTVSVMCVSGTESR